MSMHHVAIALLFDFLQMVDGTLYPVHQSTNNIKQAEYHKQLVNTYNVNVIYVTIGLCALLYPWAVMLWVGRSVAVGHSDGCGCLGDHESL